ncbi:MAG TPA: universal stress protein [Puia sp.]|jgi:nucleotide-binding universal stress UspA family protein|nr:universal stress protein [Puia sp.]
MAVAFNRILIPVDFSLNTDTAVNKAIGLAGSDEAVIYLLHVVRPGRKASTQFRAWVVERDLHQLKYDIEQANPNIRVKTNVLRGYSVQQTIIECAAMLSPDLIIFGKQNNHRRWFFSRQISPDAVAKKSNCPVLTVKPGSIDNRTRVIVLPIRNFLPERKLEWAVLLAKKYKAQVHLLAIGENAGQKDGLLPHVFSIAYHQLREKLHHPIEYSASTHRHPAKAALSYAELIMADMIVVNPYTESGISGFSGFRHLSDLLKRDSKIQVLDVEPYKSN